jgi:hypothetical protein
MRSSPDTEDRPNFRGSTSRCLDAIAPPLIMGSAARHAIARPEFPTAARTSNRLGLGRRGTACTYLN